jgi:integrase
MTTHRRRLQKAIEHWPEDIRAAWPDPAPAPYIRTTIGRLIGWAEHAGLPPLDPETCRAFVTEVEATTEMTTQMTILGGLKLGLMVLRPRTDWSWLQARQRELGRKARKKRGKKPRLGKPFHHSIPAQTWPEPYRSRWQIACQQGTANDPFGEFKNDDGPFANWSVERRREHERAWGMLLQFSKKSGHTIALSPEQIAAFVADLYRRKLKARTIQCYLQRIKVAAPFLAPNCDVEAVKMEVCRARQKAATEIKRKDGRVVTSDRLLSLGLALCAEARGHPRNQVGAATQFRDGLMIAFLAAMPVRLGSFTLIEIGRHLELGHYPGHVIWQAHEQKGRKHVQFRLWPEIRTLIDEYIESYRPCLLDGYRGCRLWLTETGGRPLSGDAIRKQIKCHTLAHLNVDMTPHLFRDAAAMTISEQAPAEMEVATVMLVHASGESTRPYREQASTIAAADRAQEIMRDDKELQAKRIRQSRTSATSDDIDPVFARFA